MCRVPNEVLMRIIDQLWRPLPPAEQSDITWQDFYQQDLARMMRVNRIAYELAGKRLYDVVATKNLPDLLDGIGGKDDDASPLTDGEDVQAGVTPHVGLDGATAAHVSASTHVGVRTTKRALLRQIGAVHVVQSQHYYQGYFDKAPPPPAYDSSMKGPDPKLMKWFSTWQTEKTGPNEPYDSLLPNLTILSVRSTPGVGPKWDAEWARVLFFRLRRQKDHGSSGRLVTHDRRTRAQSAFEHAAEIFSHDRIRHARSLRPRHTCRTASAGSLLGCHSRCVSLSLQESSRGLLEGQERDDTLDAESPPTNTLHLRSAESHARPWDWADDIHVGSHNFIELHACNNLSAWEPIINVLGFRMSRPDVDLVHWPVTRVTLMLQRPPHGDASDDLDHLRRMRLHLAHRLGHHRGDIVAKLEVDIVYADTCDPCRSCGLSYTKLPRGESDAQG